MNRVIRPLDNPNIPVIAIDMPVMYEDEGQDEMGEADEHTGADFILTIGLRAHLAKRPELRVFSNLNCYYHRLDNLAYVSPDVMVVQPTRPLLDRIRSYRIGRDGPAPMLMVEILSQRSFQQQDLTTKPIIYAELGVAEYILVDPSGDYLDRRLVLRRLLEGETWQDEQDADGGVTSVLGFRVLLEADGLPRVVDVATGRRYLRPQEAEAVAEQAREEKEKARLAEEQSRKDAENARLAKEEAAFARRLAEAEADARRQIEERLRQLEAEMARLRRPPEQTP
jgi:Uma2 family endonuclease